MPCQDPASDLGEVFRMDAKAEGEKIVIGGWRVHCNGDTRDAEWFSVALTRATAPWAYARGETFRTIAATASGKIWSTSLCGSMRSSATFVGWHPRTEGETEADQGVS